MGTIENSESSSSEDEDFDAGNENNEGSISTKEKEQSTDFGRADYLKNNELENQGQGSHQHKSDEEVMEKKDDSPNLLKENNQAIMDKENNLQETSN